MQGENSREIYCSIIQLTFITIFTQHLNTSHEMITVMSGAYMIEHKYLTRIFFSHVFIDRSLRPVYSYF